MERAYAAIPKPLPPVPVERALDELPELDPTNPHDSRAWDRTHAIAALTGIVAGLYFC